MRTGYRGQRYESQPQIALPSAPFWITVALLAALVGYPLTFGPAC